MMPLLIIQAADSVARAIPSFSDRLNFLLPLIVILLIVMFFLLLKSYSPEGRRTDNENGGPDEHAESKSAG